MLIYEKEGDPEPHDLHTSQAELGLWFLFTSSLLGIGATA